jgi:hypothetical protein
MADYSTDEKFHKCIMEQQSWECPHMLETGSDFDCEYYKCKLCNDTMTLYYDDMK